MSCERGQLPLCGQQLRLPAQDSWAPRGGSVISDRPATDGEKPPASATRSPSRGKRVRGSGSGIEIAQRGRERLALRGGRMESLGQSRRVSLPAVRPWVAFHVRSFVAPSAKESVNASVWGWLGLSKAIHG